MYKSKSISVVIPCFNESTQIKLVVETIPKFVDVVIVVNDGSTDDTLAVALELTHGNPKIVVLDLKQNLGVGGAIDAGYAESLARNCDITAVMAGDGQMNPDELEALVDALVATNADYSKITRLYEPRYFHSIPKVRLFGNSILSMLTRLSSGYWQISDSQTGYTAITHQALRGIQGDLWKGYGFPNDVLNKLGLLNVKVVEIPSKPIYGVGEKSKLNPRKVAYPILKLLLKAWIRRIYVQYFLRTLHPIGVGYFASLFGMSLGGVWITYLFVHDFLIEESTRPLHLLSALVLFQSSLLLYWLSLMFDALLNKDNSRLITNSFSGQRI